MPFERDSARGADGVRRDDADLRRPVAGDPPGSRRDLLDRCLDHEPGAWQEFLDQYGRLIFSTIHKVKLPPDDQGEAFQSSVVAIYKQLPRLRDREKIIPWIVGIAWRQAVDQIRLRSREIALDGVGEGALRPRPGTASEPPLPDHEREALENAQHAREALGALPDRCRRLITMMFYQHPPLDYAEIARRTGVPIGSLGPTRARCLKKMRDYFRRRGWIP